MSVPRRSDPDAAALAEKPATSAKPPPLYRVLLINDDFTPMEFVVIVLQQFFAMDQARAVQVMLKVHTEGRAICGIFSREVAQTKVASVMEFARTHQHPLRCVAEPN